MTVAVVGCGVRGLTAARVLSEAGVSVVLYEKEENLGGKARTVTADGNSLDLGFMLSDGALCTDMMEVFESLGVDMELFPMSFSVSLDKGQGWEWGTRNGLSSLFAQKKNVLNPYFLKIIREIIKFKDDVLHYLEDLDSNPDIDRNETLGHFIQSRGYSDLFRRTYLVPICASIWTCSSEVVMSFSAYSVLYFLHDHHFLQIFDYPQCITAKLRLQDYVKKVRQVLGSRGCQIRTKCEVCSVSSNDEGCTIRCKDGSQGNYDDCIISVNAPEAVKLLGDQATSEEIRILGAFQYAYSDVFLHRDKTLMPKTEAAWSARNFLGSSDDKLCVTYCPTFSRSLTQNIKQVDLPFLVTINPPCTPDHMLLKWTTGYPIPSVAASKAYSQISLIQGKRRIWFCGAYQGYSFHEDGIKAGILAANKLLGRSFTLQINRKHTVPSWLETGARLLVARFFQRFIATGCIIFLEPGGTTFAFEGTKKTSHLKVTLRIHSPQFYWKIATEADLGLADAYIDGDFSFVDKDKGLLNLFLILIDNNDLNAPTHEGGWWRPVLFTSAVASAKYFYKHASRRNTLTQARRNISRHYDLSNELFSLFLDETMTYSCAIFKNPDEDLKVAQLRKISLLIEKSRISKGHHVLDIGSGWGTLAIEVVKRTGCKCTGITLSEEQLKYAQAAKEAGLQDRIKFLLCDYRQLPKTEKYDRIISCGMIEHVGHEQVEEFFRCCDSSLEENGLLVLQFISIPDNRYDENRRSPGFIKEYIFPGGCVLSLSRVTSAMAAASRFCVQHVEEIGIHYYTTLRYWRKNFLQNKSQIQGLGFDEKFIRIWEFYFDYCAAGFRTRTLGDYQIVFSRPRNDAAFGDP